MTEQDYFRHIRPSASNSVTDFAQISYSIPTQVHNFSHFPVRYIKLKPGQLNEYSDWPRVKSWQQRAEQFLHVTASRRP
jgi:hypothetical protein